MYSYSTMLEPALKQQLLQFLHPDFDVEPEVKGTFLVDNTAVIVDLLLFPKEHLIAQGFAAKCVGVEVKAPAVGAHQKKKGLDASWQAVTYSQSIFQSGQGLIRPEFVLVFPHLKYFFEEGHTGWIYVSSLLIRANVGWIELDEQRKSWEFTFHSNRYFHSIKGVGGHPNAATNRRIGTRK